MKVTGFSIIRNAIKNDYPVTEAIQSILPLCDEVVVAVGNSGDDTLQLVKQIHPTKIKIIQTVWDDNLRTGGKVLAVETDKAFNAISADADWAFYIQADEVVHESTLDRIYNSMVQWKDDKRVEGLLLDYIHFYGSYDYVADSYKWHQREVRIIRNDKNIHSYKDALGFRKAGNEKLRVKHSGGLIHHYGYVKPPDKMMNKAKAMERLWHDDEWIEKNVGEQTEYDYSKIDSLKKFEGPHPAVMQERIERTNWPFKFDTNRSRVKIKYRLRKWVNEKLGISIGGYRNYKWI